MVLTAVYFLSKHEEGSKRSCVHNFHIEGLLWIFMISARRESGFNDESLVEVTPTCVPLEATRRCTAVHPSRSKRNNSKTPALPRKNKKGPKTSFIDRHKIEWACLSIKGSTKKPQGSMFRNMKLILGDSNNVVSWGRLQPLQAS